MDWRAIVRGRLNDITGNPARDEDIVEELSQHLALRFDELLSGGATPEEATARVFDELRDAPQLRRALRSTAFSASIAPVPPSSGPRLILSDLWRDVRYAARLLRRTPGFTIAGVATMALGIGMTAAIFSVVQAVLLRPVSFPMPDRLLMIWETDRSAGTSREPASLPDYLDFRRSSREVEELGAFVSTDVTLRPPDGGEPRRITSLMVTPGFLSVLGIEPVAGRTFSDDEARPGGASVALISERLWKGAFAGAPVTGAVVRLNGQPRTIIGVIPASADFGVLQILSSAAYGRGFADRDSRARVDVWLPLQADERIAPRDSHGLLLLGRLAPAATMASAQDELARIAADLERAYPSNEARGVFIEPLQQVIFGRVQTPLKLLMAAVLFLLLISCVNLASLLLARGSARVREIAIRTALGAEVPRLLRQFAAENTLLTVCGGGVGLVFAHVALNVMLSIAPANIPRLDAVSLDRNVVWLTLVICSIVGMVVGFLPLSQVRAIAPQRVLKAEDTRGATSSREGRLRSVLVVAEVAMAVVLVTGAGLLIRSFWHLQTTDPGFETRGVVKAEFELPPTRYPIGRDAAPGFAAFNRFTEQLAARARSLPGVQAAAIAAQHPLDTGFTTSFIIPGREAEAAHWPEMSIRSVTPGYFATLRVPLLRGRPLSDRDTSTSERVVVINAAVADRFFPDQDPIGRKIQFWGPPWTIVGVIGNERFHGITSAPPIAVYAPLPQTRLTTLALLVRTSGDPSALSPALRSVVREIDPMLAVFGVESLDDTFAESIAQQRFLMMMLGLFAALALILASVGVHGVLSYIVTQRTREIGVRMALGAGAGRVVRLVVAQGAVLVAIGLAAGGALALALSRTLSGLLFEVTPTDAMTLIGVIAIIGLMAAVATWLPARRAVRIDPLVALRQE